MMHDNSLLYSATELTRASMAPFRTYLKNSKQMNDSGINPLAYMSFNKSLNAGFEVLERITRQYDKPKFNIKSTLVEGKEVKVTDEVVLHKTFCDLIHFKKHSNVKAQPKLLIVAPMSGHHATLCRGTVEGLLPHFDMYITDWKNVRDIELTKGDFDMDDFINYCIEFFSHLQGNLHVMAVCQPSPPVSVAIALMASEKIVPTPKSMILVGGPIDTRVNPTEVNKYAQGKDMSWFKKNLITKVPVNYPGFMRDVYPGFIQLSSFIAMNLDRHIDAHISLFKNIIEEDLEKVGVHKKFYDEYLSVMDLPGNFYLQTIQSVFVDFSIAKGTYVSRGRKVDMGAIKDTSILVIEGGRDDITGVGQTKAIFDLCKGLNASKKHYSLQEDVGHFGLFSGSKFRKTIVPLIDEFVRKS